MLERTFLQIDTARVRVVYEDIAAGSEPGARFYILVVVSTMIACFGLVADSTAVVIGAMLVAPLMTPIFGISLGLVRGDTNLFRNAIQAEVVGVIAAVVMAFLVGMLLNLGNPFPEATSEMLARTKPNLFDLFVAVLAGFAGAYALIDEKISPALPGVAIATAIVPPLANCGLCLAYGAYQGALGSFLLFFANFLSILIVTAVLFSKVGLGQEMGTARKQDIFRRFGWAAISFLIITAFLGNALFKMVQQRRLKNIARSVLASEFADYPATRIDRIVIDRKGKRHFVLAELYSPDQINPNQVQEIEKVLEDSTKTPTELIVRIIKSTDISSSGSNSSVAAQGLDGFYVNPVGNPKIQKLRLSEQVIREYLDDHFGLDLLDVDYLELAYEQTMLAMILGVRRLSRSEISELESLLRERTEDPSLDLIVRFVQVDLYNKNGPLHYGWSTMISPTDVQKKESEILQQKIRTAFSEDGPHILEQIHTTIADEAYIFLVKISGPAPYRQDNWKQLQELLMSLTDKPVVLHVWVNQGAVLTDQGLVTFDELTEKHLKTLGDSYKKRLKEILKTAK